MRSGGKNRYDRIASPESVPNYVQTNKLDRAAASVYIAV